MNINIDRKLLELAAKAVGLRVGYESDGKECGRYDLYWSHVHHQLVWHNKSTGFEYPKPLFWNPITDDGDALRLAVKLAVLVGTFKLLRLLINSLRQEKGKHNDPLAATRLAIARAAAEIGKGLRPFPTAKEIREEWT